MSTQPDSRIDLAAVDFTALMAAGGIAMLGLFIGSLIFDNYRRDMVLLHQGQAHKQSSPISPSIALVLSALCFGGISVWASSLLSLSACTFHINPSPSIEAEGSTAASAQQVRFQPLSNIPLAVSSLVLCTLLSAASLYFGSRNKFFLLDKRDILDQFIRKATSMSISDMRNLPRKSEVLHQALCRHMSYIATTSIGHIFALMLLISFVHFDPNLRPLRSQPGLIAAVVVVASVFGVTLQWIQLRLLALYHDLDRLRIMMSLLLGCFPVSFAVLCSISWTLTPASPSSHHIRDTTVSHGWPHDTNALAGGSMLFLMSMCLLGVMESRRQLNNLSRLTREANALAAQTKGSADRCNEWFLSRYMDLMALDGSEAALAAFKQESSRSFTLSSFLLNRMQASAMASSKIISSLTGMSKKSNSMNSPTGKESRPSAAPEIDLDWEVEWRGMGDVEDCNNSSKPSTTRTVSSISSKLSSRLSDSMSNGMKAFLKSKRIVPASVPAVVEDGEEKSNTVLPAILGDTTVEPVNEGVGDIETGLGGCNSGVKDRQSDNSESSESSESDDNDGGDDDDNMVQSMMAMVDKPRTPASIAAGTATKLQSTSGEMTEQLGASLDSTLDEGGAGVSGVVIPSRRDLAMAAAAAVQAALVAEAAARDELPDGEEISPKIVSRRLLNAEDSCVFVQHDDFHHFKTPTRLPALQPSPAQYKLIHGYNHISHQAAAALGPFTPERWTSSLSSPMKMSWGTPQSSQLHPLSYATSQHKQNGQHSNHTLPFLSSLMSPRTPQHSYHSHHSHHSHHNSQHSNHNSQHSNHNSQHNASQHHSHEAALSCDKEKVLQHTPPPIRQQAVHQRVRAMYSHPSDRSLASTHGQSDDVAVSSVGQE